jgi:hypothetical protein
MCDKTVVSAWVLAARTRDRLECDNVVTHQHEHENLVGRAVTGSRFRSGLVAVVVASEEWGADKSRTHQLWQLAGQSH